MRPIWTFRSYPSGIQPVPWLAPEATEFLASIIKPEFIVMEFGGGGSTLWFAERVKQIFTFENNADWAAQIASRVGDNVTMINSDVPPSRNSTNVDMLFIDGDPVERRALWIDAIPHLVKPHGWIVLDNANRPEYAENRNWLAEIAEQKFRCQTEGGKYFVTEFYQWL